MDKFNSFAAQAKAKAEQSRVAALNKIDQQRHKPAASAQGSASGTDAGTGTGSGSGSGSGSPPPTPPNRSRASSSASPHHPQHGSIFSSHVFVGINDTDKRAFFSLLDEYFAARPQYKALFNKQAAPLAAAAVAGHHYNSTFSSSVPTPTPAPSSRAAAPPKPLPRATPAPKGLGTATALFDFDAGEAEDLGFKEGQKITILEHISDEWIKGELNGQTGIFPKVYVQLD